ncbi:MAG: phosphomannomutase/phosphoglucomutase [Armatimonadetes bacterium]|nr:phosphomannomutase/phosphoglucomutase [Armatimonadota bacterium]
MSVVFAQITPTIFREYDIRGLVGREITVETSGAIARAYAAYLRERGERRVVVGRDLRESSPQIRDAVVQALVESGCDVTDIGTVITPVFYFARVHLGIDGGVMITASHNPPEFNGFKLAHGFGTIYGSEIQEIRRIAASREFVSGRGRMAEQDVDAAYRAMLKEKIRLGPRRLRAVVDCGNGTASLMAPDALEDLGVEVVRLYCDPDPRFPNHHPDPVQPENLRDLIATVRRERADVGLGFDGDGDRIGVIDDQGTIIWGDLLMVLFWREILPKHPGTIGIVEVKCSQVLYDEIARGGGKPIFYRTGHSLIKAKMKEVGAVFTGEMSGHMFFADEYYGYDDAVYAAGRLLRILSHSDRPLSALLADLPRYPVTPEVRVDCPDERKFDVVRALTEQFRKRYEVIDVDGARVLFADGWGLVRASNTQPALVVRAEGKTPDALASIKRTLEEALSKFPEAGPVNW